MLALTDAAALAAVHRRDGRRVGDHGSDNGLAFTAIAEIAGPFWSGRALGTQNTSQLLTAGIAPPLFGALIAVAGYPVAFAVCALFPLVALPLVRRRRDCNSAAKP